MVTEQPIIGFAPTVIYGRHKDLPLYSTEENRSFIGLNVNLIEISEQSVDAIKYVIDQKYEFRPDLISYRFYRTPVLGWYVCEYNNIVDPFDPDTGLYTGRLITIPSKNKIISGLY